MKTMTALMAAMLVLAALAGCGGEGEPAEGTAEEAGQEAVGDETAPVEDVIEEPEEVVLYPEGTLNPDRITAETPVTAWALKEAYFAWDSAEVTVAGYPYSFFGDSADIDEEVSLLASPGSEEELVTVIFAEPPGITVDATEILCARGTGTLSWTGEVEVTDAELVEAPENLEPLETSPYAYDGIAPIPADQLVSLYTAWDGKEVTVEGYYHSTTTSTTDYGTTIRVDLAHPEDTYTKFAGCEMAEAIPSATESLMVAERDGVRIRGTIAGESFGNISLEGCVVVNR